MAKSKIDLKSKINLDKLTGNKKALSAVGAVALFAVAGAAIGLSKALKNADIGKKGAKVIALDHAGLLEKNVRFIENQLVNDDKELYYTLTFISKGVIYSYDIEHKTGDILRYTISKGNKSTEEIVVEE